MSYTFGAGVGDDIVATGAFQLFNDNRINFMCGWWYPTTLTATRGYWSAGDNSGAEVDTTTSEIRVRTDNGTTDGQWVTSAAGIVVNKWQFLAFALAYENSGNLGAWRIWVGDAHTEPVQQIPSVSVAAAGNATNSNLRYLGNKGSLSLAFEGQVGWGLYITMNIGVPNPLFAETTGTITTEEANLLREQLVIPIWRGVAPTILVRDTGSGSAGYSYMLIALDQNPADSVQSSHSTTAVVNPTVTINGATYSDNEPPFRSDFLKRWILGNGDSRILRRF